MTLLDQYIQGDFIEISVPKVIDNIFLLKFTNEYRSLLIMKQKEGESVTEILKTLRISLSGDAMQENQTEDFDLVFLSYLAMLKMDFPNLLIEIFFSHDSDGESKLFFQINQHRQHLLITTGQEIFKLFFNNREFSNFAPEQSASYIPLLLVSPLTIGPLFQRKKPNSNHIKRIFNFLNGGGQPLNYSQQKTAALDSVKENYLSKKQSVGEWKSADLADLYLLEVLSELNILIHVFNIEKGHSSNYQIGSSIKDPIVTARFRNVIYEVIEEEGILMFSEAEIFFLSLLVRKSSLFKVPRKTQDVLNLIFGIVSAEEKPEYQTDERKAMFRYVEIYAENLRRIIGYARDICYGLEELSKNIIEHTQSKIGIITGRIYILDRIHKLKSVDRSWSNSFDKMHRLLDINVVDCGLTGIQSSYLENLKNEMNGFGTVQDSALSKTIRSEYEQDLEALNNYGLGQFFNFNSIKLFHQINRTKARLGLLIFSQTVLSENKGFARIASSDLSKDNSEGYELFESGNNIGQRHIVDFIKMGTNYNFLLPVNERLKTRQFQRQTDLRESGASSSVFLELHKFSQPVGNNKLRNVFLPIACSSLSKYEKLDFLKEQIGITEEKELLVLDASQLSGTLVNSSDWIRFLANIQFSSRPVSQFILYNFDPEIYAELINILRIFDRIASKELGFWKKDAFVLFFFAIDHMGGKLWFNSLLCSLTFDDFLRTNYEIDLYHTNLVRISVEIEKPDDNNSQVSPFKGLLFSKSGKLLNFELLITQPSGLTIFEENAKTLLSVEINDRIDEDQ